MNIYGKTDIGRVREINQDTFVFEQLNENLSFAFVCDGMGGIDGGHVASKIATSVLFEGLCSNLSVEFNSVQIEQVLRVYLAKANEKILNYSDANNSLYGMGTTVVGAVILKKNLHIFNIGDSRAYLFHENTIKQLTVDHSYVQTLVDCGKITLDEARVHPRKNEITKALGISSKIKFDFLKIMIKKNDQLLLCSDGLTNECSDEEIEQILSLKMSVKQTTNKLIDCANNRGGFDNITVVLLKI